MGPNLGEPVGVQGAALAKVAGDSAPEPLEGFYSFGPYII